MKNKSFLIIIFCFISILFILPEDNNNYEPSWVYLKRAENLKEKGEYALAIIEARKSRDIFIKEKLKDYYEIIREKYRDKIEFELLRMTKVREQDLLDNDNYPLYHELMGDLYVLTNFIDEAEKEYKKALSQNNFFEYSQKSLEIKYKLAEIYIKKMDYELADIIYREIVNEYFAKKNNEFWNRVKLNIKDDPTLNHVFLVYRINGMEYLKALYMIGRRSALLQRKTEALYFLVNAAIVWMTHYSSLIKKYHFDFQYSNPSDFINYISKKKLYEYESEEYLMDEILFFVGYIYQLDKNEKLSNHFFNLAILFSKNTKNEYEINNRIEYFKKDKNHILKYEEFLE